MLLLLLSLPFLEHHFLRFVDLFVQNSVIVLEIFVAHVFNLFALCHEFYQLGEELLSVGSDVRYFPSPHILLDLLPVLTIDFKGLEELLMLIWSPSAEFFAGFFSIFLLINLLIGLAITAGSPYFISTRERIL